MREIARNAKKYKRSKKGIKTRKRNYHRDPLQQKNRSLLYQYGITLEQFKEMSKAQGDVCWICEKPERRMTKWGSRQKWLLVDHCAKTGKVRGLLCHRCNVALGLLYHDIERLKTAIQYLSRD